MQTFPAALSTTAMSDSMVTGALVFMLMMWMGVEAEPVRRRPPRIVTGVEPIASVTRMAPP